MMLRPGDVVFHRGDTPVLARAIRRVVRAPWGHVSLVTSMQNAEPTVLDVAWTRRLRYLSDFDGWEAYRPRYAEGLRAPGRTSLAGIPNSWTGEQVARHALDLHETTHRRYPTRELLAYLPWVRQSGLGRALLRRSDRLVCSAFVAAAWHSMGFRWYDRGREVSPDWVDPGIAWRQCQRDQWRLVGAWGK